jgi:para-nitrobenzyl esterase
MSNKNTPPNASGILDATLDRRTLLDLSLRGCSAMVASSLFGGPVARSAFAAGGSSPIVETIGGKVRGAGTSGIQTFLGVPYGASTEGAGRFQPPQKAMPWPGVRDALHVGPVCPQAPRTLKNHDIEQMIFSGAYEKTPQYGEDCLVLNVWTPALRDGRKRPVMVWLHGGGYAAGSGGAPWYDGTNLAREGDVVVVAINHRLNLFGYLYLGDLAGGKYADSGNAGMLDIVMALEWVRDNITGFGGDPGNVTIFGESGGAGKVSVLMAMPPAKDLFHKAIVQSGSTLKSTPRDDATKRTKSLLASMGLKESQVDQLQKLSADQLLTALAAGDSGAGSGPVVDGRSLPADPFDPKAPSISARVPMLIGTNKEETVLLIGGNDPAAFSLDEAGLRARLKKSVGGSDEAASKLIAVYRKTRPNATPSDLFFDISTDLSMRKNAITQAERKTEQGTAPAYMYLLTWQSLGFGGRYKTLHASDLPFVFDNVDKASALTNNDPRCQVLAEKMSRAWIAFARAGDPNHSGLPKWDPYSLNERATMIFDYDCKAVNDPFSEERITVASV